jgi:CheY-like chemotaxis protein
VADQGYAPERPRAQLSAAKGHLRGFWAISLLSGRQALPYSKYPNRFPEIALADHRILVIDDEAPICNALQRALSREHRSVVALTSAREALMLLSEGRRFDAIICDYFMPEMTGAELYARVDPRLRDRIVFLTGGALTGKGQDFLASIENPCILKPVSMTVVSTMVRQVIARRANAVTVRPPSFPAGSANDDDPRAEPMGVSGQRQHAFDGHACRVEERLVHFDPRREIA